ncbi:divergent polysaccharide deacetylase family protein [Zavarzinia aquatilis]|nr:divergent polysaccharide deacetylase family protein [Zavarzinia aquatilis]
MASSKGKTKRPAGRRKGSGRRRGGVLGNRAVRRAIVGGWAVVVAVAVGFLLMRAMDERMPSIQPIAARDPAPVAPVRPSSPTDAVDSAPRVTARPVERPADIAAVPPPPPVAAEEQAYDSRPAWQRFAMAPPAQLGKKPVIAIVIDDVGVTKRELDSLLALDAGVTFSIMGYADNMADFARKARAGGHELLVHVPMQPEGNADPGPKALTLGLSPAEIRARLRWQLDRHDGFVGINNHMGSRFSADAAGMAVVMAELKARGLLFLDSRTAAGSVGEEKAKEAGLPTASRDVFLDNEIGANAIEAQLVLAERRARDKGTAIAIGHPHEATIEALARFIPQAQARGIVFVPVSTVIARRSGLDLPTAAAAGAAAGTTAGPGKRSELPPRPRG